MSGIDFSKLALPQTQNQGNGRQNNGPEPEVYGNVGMTVQLPNAETGEMEPVFVSLERGIAIDVLEPMTARAGSTAKWIQLVQAKNWLLEQFQSAAKDLAPGETVKITGIEIEIRRKGGVAEVPAEGENPLLAGMAGKLSIVA